MLPNTVQQHRCTVIGSLECIRLLARGGRLQIGPAESAEQIQHCVLAERGRVVEFDGFGVAAKAEQAVVLAGV